MFLFVWCLVFGFLRYSEEDKMNFSAEFGVIRGNSGRRGQGRD